MDVDGKPLAYISDLTPMRSLPIPWIAVVAGSIISKKPEFKYVIDDIGFLIDKRVSPSLKDQAIELESQDADFSQDLSSGLLEEA